MYYILKPSLEHIALVKTAITLWNQEDITALITKFSFPLLDKNMKKWIKIEAEVSKKVYNLPIPEVLKEKVLNIVKPIGLQIAKWNNFRRESGYGISLSNELLWTAFGAIDIKAITISLPFRDLERLFHLSNIFSSDVLFILLSRFSESDQLKLFEKHPNCILSCLLDWPYQNFFLETAGYMWNFISEQQFGSILIMIINKVIDGFRDFDYKELFTEMWKQSPSSLKKFLEDRITLSSLLSKLLQIDDKRNFNLVIQDASPEAKNKLIFSVKGREICDKLLHSKEWSMLDFLVRECISTKDDLTQFIEEMDEYLSLPCSKSHKRYKPTKSNKRRRRK